MAAYPRVGDLEIDQDLDYEKRAWTVRRVGWALMTLTVLAALAGLLGKSGPLNRTRAGEGGPVAIEHERFARFQTETTVEIHVRPPASATEARVWIDREYLGGMQIDGMVPEPDRIETGADRLVLVFPLAADRAAGPGGFQLDLHLQPQRIGSQTGRVGLDGGPALDFHQFVYP